MAKKAAAKTLTHPADTLSRRTGEGRGEGRPSSLLDTRVIYCGDNLEQLAKLPDACVDLIYIDPPFNSNRDYEIFWPETSEKRRFDDRHESTTAYIDYMRPRCEQLARVLKKTGSFYFHCDWHASHYVKVMLDVIFGENNFVNEIIWKRTSAHGNAGKRYAITEDRIFFYAKSKDWTWNPPYLAYSEEYIASHYGQKEEGTGRRFTTRDLTASMQRASQSQIYDWKGFRPLPTRCWAYTKENMEKLEADGRLVYSERGMPRLTPITNAYAYEVQVRNGTADWKSAGMFTQARRIVLTGLTSGSTYSIQARAIGGSTGSSGWSDSATHVVT